MRRTKTTATRWGHIIDDFFAVMKRGYNIYPKQYTIIYDNKVCSDVRNCMFSFIYFILSSPFVKFFNSIQLFNFVQCCDFGQFSILAIFCLAWLIENLVFCQIFNETRVECRIRKILLYGKMFCWIAQPYTLVETRAHFCWIL